MNNVEVLENNKLYRINFNIPVQLRNTYDIFIEDVVGCDERAILNDVVEEEIGGRIKGYLELEFENFDMSVIEDRSKQLEMLSNGFDLIQ